MYIIFENFTLECRVSFEILAFIGLIVTTYMVVFAHMVRKLHEKVDRILDNHQVQTPHTPTAPQNNVRTTTHIRSPPAQPSTPGGVRLHAILDKLPAHFATVIATSSDRLSQEFSTIRTLESALAKIYPSEHMDEALEKLAEDILGDFTPSFQDIVDLVVISMIVECDWLWFEHIKQRTGRDIEDARMAEVMMQKAKESMGRLRAKLGNNSHVAQCSATPTVAAPGYTDLFDTPDAWKIQA